MSQYTIVIHGGAGTILRKHMTDALELSYSKALEDALEAGYALLSKGGSALDAVRAAVVSLEDNILFNAGKGSVFGKDGSQLSGISATR
jgi:L-asparaginase / beta-aspartyl-peptidase